MAKESTPTPKKLRLPMFILAFLLIVAICGGAYFYMRYKELDESTKLDPAQSALRESEDVLTSVKKLLLITEQEDPTIARIDEPEKLKSTNAEFYKDVQVGDYLIVYPNRAIIYRTSNNQIINFAPIVDAVNPASPATGAQATE